MNRFRKYILGFAFLLTTAPMSAQMKWNQTYQTYINQYKDLAIEQMLRYRIPASITLAQGLFESAAGRSDLVRQGNNHFGIKCHTSWMGPKQYHDDDARGECFRVYSDAKESYEDHSQFLARQSRYASLFNLSTSDYKGWARGLKQCGYATNPQYANKLIQIIELYKLHEYDKAKRYDKFMAEHSGTDQPINAQGFHPIHLFNDNYYLYAREGDTFKGIGKEVGISWKKLAKYNERDKNDILHKGDIIYLKKKRKKAPKQYKKRPHIVQAGESMYGISQKYGIRLKNLYKMNGLDPDFKIYPGARLRVR